MPQHFCRYGNWGRDDRSFPQEKEVGELAPTGQCRKSVVLLVTLDRLSHAHLPTNIITCALSPRTLKWKRDTYVSTRTHSQPHKRTDAYTWPQD